MQVYWVEPVWSNSYNGNSAAATLTILLIGSDISKN